MQAIRRPQILRSFASTPKQSRINLRTVGSVSVLSLVAGSWFYFIYPKDPSVPVKPPMQQRQLPKVDILPAEVIKSMLHGKETKFASQSQKLEMDFNSVASNNPIEDYHCEHSTPTGTIIGVFDGHGGRECAVLAQKHLASYISDRLSLPQLPSMTRSEHVTSALRQAFVQLDTDILNGVVVSTQQTTQWWHMFDGSLGYNAVLENLKGAVAGSCAIVAYIEGPDVYVACTGDSRAIIGRDKGYIKDGQKLYEAVELSVDQTPANPKEYARIIDEHPGEEQTVISRGRILGGLMPSRAFGDARYKWPASTIETVMPHLYPTGRRRLPSNYKTPPYVTATPEIVHYKRDESDKFMVIATDGLWDELESETVAQFTGTLLESGSSSGNSATMLVKRALGGPDLNEERISHNLSIPAPLSRRYRDDITVNVIKFNSDAAGELPPVPAKSGSSVAHLPKWLSYLRSKTFQSKL
jgi:pyruvate dehydrogenase phosphatase